MLFEWLRGWSERRVRAMVNVAGRYLKQWTKPDRESLLVGSITGLPRSKVELIAENGFLRQQVIVLKGQSLGPQLRRRDRRLLVLLASRRTSSRCHFSTVSG